MSTNVKFLSLKPLYGLLQKYESPPTQLFAAWTIGHLCLLDSKNHVIDKALDAFVHILRAKIHWLTYSCA